MTSDGETGVNARDLLTLVPLPEFTDRKHVMNVARELATQLWRESGQDKDGIIDPLAMAGKRDCIVTFAALNPGGMDNHAREWVSGAIYREVGARPQIAIERRDEDFRNRCTIAHELAHLVSTPDDESIDEIRRPYARPEDDEEYFRRAPKEYFADMFAHMLLIPDSILKLLLDEGLSDEQVSFRMKVSRRTAELRRKYWNFERGLGTI